VVCNYPVFGGIKYAKDAISLCGRPRVLLSAHISPATIVGELLQCMMIDITGGWFEIARRVFVVSCAPIQRDIGEVVLFSHSPPYLGKGLIQFLELCRNSIYGQSLCITCASCVYAWTPTAILTATTAATLAASSGRRSTTFYLLLIPFIAPLSLWGSAVAS